MQLTVRQPSNSKDAKHYTTERLREEYLIETIFVADEAVFTYSHFDRIIAGGVMPVTKAVELTGSKEMAESVAAALTDRRGALIANHGSIAMGETLEKALTGVTILEKTAQIWIDVQALGSYVEISKEDCEFFHDFFKNKYGQKK